MDEAGRTVQRILDHWIAHKHATRRDAMLIDFAGTRPNGKLKGCDVVGVNYPYRFLILEWDDNQLVLIYDVRTDKLSSRSFCTSSGQPVIKEIWAVTGPNEDNPLRVLEQLAGEFARNLINMM